MGGAVHGKTASARPAAVSWLSGGIGVTSVHMPPVHAALCSCTSPLAPPPRSQVQPLLPLHSNSPIIAAGVVVIL